MLAVNSYPRAYVDACRSRVQAQISAYEAVTALAGACGEPRLRDAIGAFEPQFCNHMVLALDMSFCHRQRGLEGKDGNAINEVRMLNGSILHHGAVLAADKTIRYKPASSILGYAIGDPIKLRAADFARLAEAFLAEIERRYPEAAPVAS